MQLSQRDAEVFEPGNMGFVEAASSKEQPQVIPWILVVSLGIVLLLLAMFLIQFFLGYYHLYSSGLFEGFEAPTLMICVLRQVGIPA